MEMERCNTRSHLQVLQQFRQISKDEGGRKSAYRYTCCKVKGDVGTVCGSCGFCMSSIYAHTKRSKMKFYANISACRLLRMLGSTDCGVQRAQEGFPALVQQEPEGIGCCDCTEQAG